MSLKAGRVGVNPADVDPIDGHISPASISAYTKQEADAKFQPLTLAVPVKYLDGSQIGLFNTVQEALSGSYGENGAMTNEELSGKVALVETTEAITSTNTFATDGKILYKIGNMVFPLIKMTNVTAAAYSVIATISSAYRPKKNTRLLCVHNGLFGSVDVNANGEIQTLNALTDETLTISGCVWII